MLSPLSGTHIAEGSGDLLEGVTLTKIFTQLEELLVGLDKGLGVAC